MEISILNYTSEYESLWVECLKEAFYASLYSDTMIKVKPRYENPVLELVAFDQTNLIGFLDVEIVPKTEQYCNDEGEDEVICGQISLIGVHPDYRRNGIARNLLKTAIKQLINDFKVERLEIVFRKDSSITGWIESVSFQECAHFYEITLTDDFFEKYGIELPFGINPSLFTGFVDEEGYRLLSNQHGPEKKYQILIYKKNL